MTRGIRALKRALGERQGLKPCAAAALEGRALKRALGENHALKGCLTPSAGFSPLPLAERGL